MMQVVIAKLAEPLKWWCRDDGPSLYQVFAEEYDCVFGCGARWDRQPWLVVPEDDEETRLACCELFASVLPPRPQAEAQRIRQNQKPTITWPPSELLMRHRFYPQQKAFMLARGFSRSVLQKWEVHNMGAPKKVEKKFTTVSVKKMPADVWRRAGIAAHIADQDMGEWLAEAITEKLERESK